MENEKWVDNGSSKPVGDLSSMEVDNGSSKPLKIAFNGGQVLKFYVILRQDFMKIEKRNETRFQILGILIF